MGRRTMIAVADQDAGGWADRLRGSEYDVCSVEGPITPCQGPPDLILIDAGERPDVVAVVRACRERWPAATLPVLVLNVGDPQLGSAAIEAGATDAVVDAREGPMLDAHVRRLLRAGEMLRGLLDAERRRAQREGLALAAADVAVPLGAMVDLLESAMTRRAPGDSLNDLLELTVQAVDAVDRLRILAQSADTPVDAVAELPCP